MRWLHYVAEQSVAVASLIPTSNTSRERWCEQNPALAKASWKLTKFDVFDGDAFDNFDPLGGIGGDTGLLGLLTSPAVILVGGGVVLFSVMS